MLETCGWGVLSLSCNVTSAVIMFVLIKSHWRQLLVSSAHRPAWSTAVCICLSHRTLRRSHRSLNGDSCYWKLLFWFLKLDSFLVFFPPRRLLPSFYTAPAACLPVTSHCMCGWLCLIAPTLCFTCNLKAELHSFKSDVLWVPGTTEWQPGAPGLHDASPSASRDPDVHPPPFLSHLSSCVLSLSSFAFYKANRFKSCPHVPFGLLQSPTHKLVFLLLSGPSVTISTFKAVWSVWKIKLIIDFACVIAFNGSL